MASASLFLRAVSALCTGSLSGCLDYSSAVQTSRNCSRWRIRSSRGAAETPRKNSAGNLNFKRESFLRFRSPFFKEGHYFFRAVGFVLFELAGIFRE